MISRIFYVLFGLTAAPLAFRHFAQLNARSMYQYFPFVLAFAAWGFWTAWKQQDGDIVARRPGRQLAMVIVATLILALGVLCFNPWMVAVSLVVMVAGLICGARDQFRGSFVWAVWSALLLVIPLPFDLTDRLSRKLQAFSSRASSDWLDLFRVDHLLMGNTIRLTGRELFVDEACSGVVSLMSVVACAAMFCIWKRRTLIHAILLILSGVLWTLSMNVVRIFVIAAALKWWDWDLSSGTPHAILGAVVFAFTAVAVLSTDMFLKFLLGEIPVVEGLGTSHENRLIQTWNWLVAGQSSVGSRQLAGEESPVDSRLSAGSADFKAAWLMGAVLMLPLIGYQAKPMVQRWAGPADNSQRLVEAMRAMPADAVFPEMLGDWRRVDSQKAEREVAVEAASDSTLAYYRLADGTQVTLSIDYPFIGEWHELCLCYRSGGWQQLSRAPCRDEEVAMNGPAAFVEADYQLPETGGYGHLVYGLVNSNNQLVLPPKLDEGVGSLVERLVAKLKRRQPTYEQTSFQVQVFAQGTEQFDDAQSKRLKELFLLARKDFRKRLERVTSDE